MGLNYAVANNDYGLNVLRITFDDCEMIELDLADFYKDQADMFNLYSQINEYVQTLPLYTQKEIYDVFYKVYSQEYRQNYNDVNYIIKLENKIAKVSELLNYQNFKMWMAYKEDQMNIPENIRSDYIYDPDMNTTEEKTYIKNEYRDLISLIIFIRAISPLYLDFYVYIKQITNHYYYKIFMLFIRSDVYTCPEIDKLKRYIEANQITLIGNTKNEHLIINAGLSDDDILDSLVSEIIFNKLLTIDFFSKKCNIISFIFQTIKYKGSFITSDSVVIRSKTTVAGGDNNKEDMSYFEDYRKTSSIPIGTVVEIQHSLSNIEFLVNALGHSNFDYAAYERELQNVPALIESKADRTQTYLLGWFISKIINPRALYYIEYKRFVELCLFAKVVLMSNGHEFIGMLLSSVRSKEASYINVLIRNGVNKTLVKRLANYYNFCIEEDKQSVIEKTVSEISKEIANCLWIPVGDPEQIAKFTNKDGYLNIPNNINDVVCSYIDFINS